MRSITVEQELPLSIEPRDSRGNIARVDGDPVWTLTDETLGALVPGATPFEKTFKPAGLIGAALISVTVDADLGEGIKPLTGTFTVAVIPGEASTLAINAGEAVTPAPAPTPEPAPVDPVTAETPVAAEPVAVPVEAVTEPVVEAPAETPVAEPAPVEAPAEAVTAPVAEPVAEAPAAPVSETPAEGGETPAV